jgi:glutamyl-Q tRNA(Asp) synthetase
MSLLLHRRSAPSYIGRFAPSPTGALHAGSLVAALASWLDARAHGGRWLVRIEDIDQTRCLPGADHFLLGQLQALGLIADAPPLWQSACKARYQGALDELLGAGLAYPCGCSRRDIELALQALQPGRARHSERVYPGTCRQGLQGKPGRALRARTDALLQGRSHDLQPALDAQTAPDAPRFTAELQTPAAEPAATAGWRVDWHDRRLGPQQQDLTRSVGDFVLRRADGIWAYQLAVVVDDGAQAISHVVRGADLTDNTPRQLWLQKLLGLPHPRYLHVPLVCDARGEKLSKQHGAPAVDTSSAAACRQALNNAAMALQLPAARAQATPTQALHDWTVAWAQSLPQTKNK